MIHNIRKDASAGNGGLFGFVQGTVRNIRILNGEIYSNDDSGAFGYGIGAIAGSLTEGGIIDNCHNGANVTASKGYFGAGGIVGFTELSSSIINCSNSGTISGLEQTGGIVGWVFDNASNSFYNNYYITACRNTGSVTSRSSGTSTRETAGGIVGLVYHNSAIFVTACYNTGSITGNSSWVSVSGIVGNMFGGAATVTACYNTGPVVNSGGGPAYGIGGTAVTACYWQAGTAADGMDTSGGPDTTEPPFTSTFNPTGTHSQWRTAVGDNGGTGAGTYWKNLTGNGGLPKLWWEP